MVSELRNNSTQLAKLFFTTWEMLVLKVSFDSKRMPRYLHVLSTFTYWLFKSVGSHYPF